jgi:hypothetical protein
MERSDAHAEDSSSAAEVEATTTTVQDDDDTNVPTNCSANSRRCFLCKAQASSKSSTELMMKAAAGEEGQDPDRRRLPVNLAIGLKYVCDVLELDDGLPTTTTSSAAANPTAFCFFCSGVMLDILKVLSEMEALRKKLDVRVRILKSRVESANKLRSSVENFDDEDSDDDDDEMGMDADSLDNAG